MMFEYIFWTYKKDICGVVFTKSVKQMTWIERGVFAAIIILSFVAAWLIYLRGINIVTLLLSLFILPIISLIPVYENRRIRKARLDEYLQRILNIIDLLEGEGEDYYLCNKKSIDWLIERCNKIIGSTIFEPLTTIAKPLLPIMMLAFGALLGESDKKELLIIASIIAVFVACFVIYAFFLEFIFGEDKRIAQKLKMDLEYISTLLPD
jgi:hypothetical protein